MANEAEIARWAGEQGDMWLAREEIRMAGLAPFAELLLSVAGPAPGEHVLDIGCGTGPTSEALADAVGPGGRVVGVDVSPPLLEVARSRSAGRGHLDYLEADAQVHAFDPVDLVASRFGVMFFDDPVAAFTNLAAALRPGGRVAFVCWQLPGPHNPMFTLPSQALAGLVELPPPPAPDAPGPIAFGRPERVHSILTGAGLGDVAIEPHSRPMWMGPSDPLDVASVLVRQSRLREVIGALDDATRDQAIEAVAGALEPYRREDGIWLDGAVWAVTARKP